MSSITVDTQTMTENNVPNIYQQVFEAASVVPVSQQIHLSHYTNAETLATRDSNERLAAALQVLLQFATEDGQAVNKVDKILIDHFIARIDDMMSAQLDEIFHNDAFQQMESVWRGLKYVVDNVDFGSNIKLEMLDVDKQTLKEDFEESTDTTQSGLYKHVYTDEYDTPGGEPFAAMVSAESFDSSTQDVTLLQNIAKIASVAHCPFLASANAQFFHKDTMDEVHAIDDLENHMNRAEYIKWRSFRDSEDARYIGLTLPRFLIRMPYGEHNPAKQFNYQERVCEHAEQYLWAPASFALAVNLCRSFKDHGWCVNIRGSEAGGKVHNLPLHQYDVGRGTQTKIPSEVLISETKELDFSNQGFIPLSYYKNSDFACFFSANSIQKPALYQDANATANSRINARLPYVFLSARIAHYLKVIQRENIGSSKSRSEQEAQLNYWLNTLITKMNNPGPELAASHPLRDGRVTVAALDDNPGFYRVELYAVPHFQIEGMDVKLSLVGQLPADK